MKFILQTVIGSYKIPDYLHPVLAYWRLHSNFLYRKPPKFQPREVVTAGRPNKGVPIHPAFILVRRLAVPRCDKSAGMGHAHLFLPQPVPSSIKFWHMKYLSDYLRILRASHKRTQSYMAGTLGIDQSKYSRIERGLDKVSVEDLAIIAEEFGIEIHELLEMAKTPPSLIHSRKA